MYCNTVRLPNLKCLVLSLNRQILTAKITIVHDTYGILTACSLIPPYTIDGLDITWRVWIHCYTERSIHVGMGILQELETNTTLTAVRSLTWARGIIL